MRLAERQNKPRTLTKLSRDPLLRRVFLTASKSDFQTSTEKHETSLIKMAGTCANSSCTANATKRCAGCKQASYCCSSCQRLDWPHHKSACKKRSKSPNADASPYHCSNLGCLARRDQVNMPCARCNGATYCSTLCQKEHWEDHKPNCRPASMVNDTVVMAVMIHSQTDGHGRYSALLVPGVDPIFETAPVPISQKIGFPLLVRRSKAASAGRPLGDNPHATWLMISPATGLAPAEWQCAVGNVVVARADGEALEIETLGALTDYISDIMEAFENGAGAAQKYYNRDRLDRFIEDHVKMQQDFQRFKAKSFVTSDGRKMPL